MQTQFNHLQLHGSNSQTHHLGLKFERLPYNISGIGGVPSVQKGREWYLRMRSKNTGQTMGLLEMMQARGQKLEYKTCTDKI